MKFDEQREKNTQNNGKNSEDRCQQSNRNEQQQKNKVEKRKQRSEKKVFVNVRCAQKKRVGKYFDFCCIFFSATRDSFGVRASWCFFSNYMNLCWHYLFFFLLFFFLLILFP